MNERLAGKLALVPVTAKKCPETFENCRKAGGGDKIMRYFNKLAYCRPNKPVPQSLTGPSEALAAQAKNVYIRRN
jgi:hypothetical protein